MQNTINIEYFLESCETQQTLAFLFNAKHNGLFKYTKIIFIIMNQMSHYGLKKIKISLFLLCQLL